MFDHIQLRVKVLQSSKRFYMAALAPLGFTMEYDHDGLVGFGPDLPALDIVSTAKGFGCASVEARTGDEIKAAFSKALSANGPTVIATPISRKLKPLI